MRKQPRAPKACDVAIQVPGYDLLNEHQIQAALFRAYKARRVPGAVMFAIPNGGARDAVTGRLMKDEGVTPGAPDLFCAPFGERCFFIELKAVGGSLSKAQKEFHASLVAAGQDVVVCRGFLEAIAILESRGVIRAPKVRQGSHAKEIGCRKGSP
jgi:hypothetical protein